MSQDSTRTYANLSKYFGNPISIESYSKDFSDALSYTPDKRRVGTVIRALNKDPRTKNAPANANRRLNEYYIASDTIIWASSIANDPNATTGHTGISFQGYANCSTFVATGLSGKFLPSLFLGFTFLSVTLPLLFKRYRKELIMSQPIHPGKTTSSGNLNPPYETVSFYREDEEKLKLAPQQYALMKMFFLLPTHTSSRSDICESLWPGKVNADETSSTLI